MTKKKELESISELVDVYAKAGFKKRKFYPIYPLKEGCYCRVAAGVEEPKPKLIKDEKGTRLLEEPIEPLTDYGKKLVLYFTGGKGLADVSCLKAFLVQNCGVAAPESYRWKDILSALEQYKESEEKNAGNRPVETEADGKITEKWKIIRERANKHIKSAPFPGVKPLAKILGCAPGTLRKAIKNSVPLTRAKAEYDQKNPRKEASLNPAIHSVGKRHGRRDSHQEVKLQKKELIEKIKTLVSKQSKNFDLNVSAPAHTLKGKDLWALPVKQLQAIYEALKQNQSEYKTKTGMKVSDRL